MTARKPLVLNSGRIAEIPAGDTAVVPALQVTGGTPGTGKVLTSDGSGNASWATPDVTQAELDAVVVDSIADADTTHAPSRNAVFDALATKQGLDATLTALAALTTAADTLIYATGADAFTTTALTSAARALLDDADATTMRATLGLAIGTNVQAYDADLTTWAGITAPAGAPVGTSDTQTLTNKRVTKRVGTTTSSATPTINTDNVDMYTITALTVAITSMTTNLSGTPTDGQTLWIAITGTAARAITWGTSFEASTVALPTTTVTTNRLDVGFVWNAATSKWRCVAVA